MSQKRRLCCPPEHSVFIGGNLFGINKKRLTECIWNISKQTGCNIGKFHVLKSEDNDFGHIHLENENDAGTFFNKVQEGEFYVDGKEFLKLKEIVGKLVPLIRFKWILSDFFYKQVRPYKLLFDNDAYEEIMQFYLVSNSNAPRPINFLASKHTGSKNSIVYKILDEPTTSTIEPPTILNEPTTSEPSISIEHFKEFGTERFVEFLKDDKNLSELKLDDSFFTKIKEEKIIGYTFLKLTKCDLRECGLRLGPSLELEEYIRELGAKKY